MSVILSLIEDGLELIIINLFFVSFAEQRLLAFESDGRGNQRLHIEDKDL